MWVSLTETVEVANSRMQDSEGWLGAYSASGITTGLRSESFDTILCTETFEHLDDKTLQNVTEEIHRLLRPGGALLVTTPCGEDLA